MLLEIENFVFGKFYDKEFATEPFDNVRFGLVAKIFLPLMRKYSAVESKNFIIRHYKNFREILKTPFDAFFKEQLVLMTSVEEHLLANCQLSRTKIDAFLIQLQEKTSVFLIYDIFYQTTTPEILKEICDSIYGQGSQGNELNKDLITFGFQLKRRLIPTPYLEKWFTLDDSSPSPAHESKTPEFLAQVSLTTINSYHCAGYKC